MNATNFFSARTGLYFWLWIEFGPKPDNRSRRYVLCLLFLARAKKLMDADDYGRLFSIRGDDADRRIGGDLKCLLDDGVVQMLGAPRQVAKNAAAAFKGTYQISERGHAYLEKCEAAYRDWLSAGGFNKLFEMDLER